MAINDLVKLNGETRNLPARREEQNYPQMFGEMNRWMNQWDQWFDRMFSRSFGSTGLTPWRDSRGAGLSDFVPAVNITETESEFKVTAELPGIDPADVELTLNRGVLTIRGEKKHEQEQTTGGIYRMERSYGSFQRTVRLPEQVDQDNVGASYKHGVLTVTVPKLPELKRGTKRIEIKSEDK